MVEALGTGEIPAELSAILAACFRMVRKYGAALSSEKRLGRGIHSFLAQMALGVDLIPILDQVTFVGVETYRMVHCMHFIFSVRVDLYLTSRRLFACLGDLPAEGLPPVVDIPHEAFAALRSIAPCHEWTTSLTLGGSPLPIGRKGQARGWGRRL